MNNHVFLTFCFRIFCLGILLLPPSLYANVIERVMFRQITTSEGLSNNNINCLYRDSRGFLWIGTNSGLNRHDSYNLQQYYQDTDGLPSNSIGNIFEDWDGNIWIGSEHGYTIYDYQTGSFSPDCKTRLHELNIPCDTVSMAGMDSKMKYLWVYDNNKIYLYNPQQKMTKIYPLMSSSISKLVVTDKYIYSIYNDGRLFITDINSSLNQEVAIPSQYGSSLRKHFPKVYVDSNDGIWVHTFQNSLLLYKKNLQTEWQEIKLPAHDEQFNRIRNIAEDHNGNIWLITSHLGAFIYQLQSGDLTQFSHNPLKSHTLASNNLSAIHIDREGIVWIGNFRHGVSYYVPQSQVFLNQKLWRYNDIISFCEDSLSIWYGTDGGGLMRQGRNDPMPQQVATPANVIVTIKKDSQGKLWLGTFQNGLICYDQGRTTQYTSENSGLLENDIYGIQEDEAGNILIGVLDGSIQRLDTQTQKIETLLNMQGELSIRELLYTGHDTLYVATSQGLLMLNTGNGQHHFIRHNKRNSQALKKQFLYAICRDSRGILWMGGSQGIAWWNLNTDSIGYIDHNNGLPANMVTAIAEDNNHQMWVGTCNGIARINLSQGTPAITNYDVGDGIISNDVNEKALYKLRNGNILVGTPNGYTTIIPQEIVHDAYKAKVCLTDIEPQYYPLPQMLNGKSPECASAITLKEELPFLSLHFSTLDFIEPRKVRYAYRLKGQQADWNYATDNQINFSLLPPGTYELQVRACNSEYMWSPNVKTLKIHILPPWYRTWWANCIVTAAILLIGWASICHFRTKRKRLAVLKTIEQENERQQKLTDMKMQFFANVSHELRTPLSLIINPLEEFLAKNPQYQNGLLGTVQSNARYLLELINQLLNFRKLDAHGETMQYVHGDIVSLVKDQFQAFESIAQKRGIGYRLTSQQPSILMEFDYDKVRKIAMNLLSNAFKFTEDGGDIEIKINIVAGNVVMQFCDTGCGIDPGQQEKIFQCFYQGERRENHLGGSGIGLYLVAEYIKMHNGNIQVSTNLPKGSIFTVTLPMHAASASAPQEAPGKENETLPDLANEERKGSYTILLADDNSDFLDFLSACLATNYNVLKASNGKEALEMLKTENADIVISDVMMPAMNGLELCSAIKADPRTRHIPVILLTAKASEEYQLEGLNTGADDYITKPFNMEILKLRISKLIENNLKKHEQEAGQLKIEPSRIAITPLDQQFVEKAIQIVEDNINNADFSVEDLATSLNISRGYLYKKVIKITGKTTLEFIRLIRMKRAQQLLAESQLQVAEIAYKLGYNSPKIFTKHFKEEFGMTPSEYMRRQAKGGEQ